MDKWMDGRMDGSTGRGKPSQARQACFDDVLHSAITTTTTSTTSMELAASTPKQDKHPESLNGGEGDL